MGDVLTAVEPGMRLALPPSPVVFDEDSISRDPTPTASTESSEGSPADVSPTVMPSAPWSIYTPLEEPAEQTRHRSAETRVAV